MISADEKALSRVTISFLMFFMLSSSSHRGEKNREENYVEQLHHYRS